MEHPALMNVLILARVICGLSLTAMNTFGFVSYHAGRPKTNVLRTISKLASCVCPCEFVVALCLSFL